MKCVACRKILAHKYRFIIYLLDATEIYIICKIILGRVGTKEEKMSFDILLILSAFSRVKLIRGTVVLWELVNPQKLDK